MFAFQSIDSRGEKLRGLFDHSYYSQEGCCLMVECDSVLSMWSIATFRTALLGQACKELGMSEVDLQASLK